MSTNIMHYVHGKRELSKQGQLGFEATLPILNVINCNKKSLLENEH